METKSINEKTEIEGLVTFPLKTISNESGKVMHMLRKDSPNFKEFGEVYFSFTNPGVTKKWKLHKVMEQNFVVPVGRLKLVVFDNRENSPSYGKLIELILSPDDYFLAHIPAGLWYGFQAISDEPAMIVNCASIIHDPNEVEYKEINDPQIPYCWT